MYLRIRSLTYFLRKSSSVRFAWRKIDLKVPGCISLPWIGTMTVSVGLPIFLYLACEPVCEIKKKPLFSRTFTTNRSAWGLGILKSDRCNSRSFYFSFFRKRYIFKI